MSEKETFQFKVYSGGNGDVCISQQVDCDDDNVIIIHPEQIDLLIKWLNETRDELQAN